MSEVEFMFIGGGLSVRNKHKYMIITQRSCKDHPKSLNLLQFCDSNRASSDSLFARVRERYIESLAGRGRIYTQGEEMDAILNLMDEVWDKNSHWLTQMAALRTPWKAPTTGTN
jgi:hypothetical protein